MTKTLSDKDVIATFRTLLAACVHRHGVLNRLVISEEDLQSCESGRMTVQQLPNGSIELKIRAVPKLLAVQ